MQTPNKVILDSMARTLFVLAWADREEERGRSHSGQELMDVAPKTPRKARDLALMLAGAIEQINGMCIESLVWAAWKSDGNGTPDSCDDVPDSYRDRFGHCLVMQSLGTGAAWTDDHAEVRWGEDYGMPRTMKLPRVEGMHL